MNSKNIQTYIGTLATPLVAVIGAVIVYFIVTKGIKAWTFRNLGTSAGVDDFTNLATEWYRVFSGWPSPDQISKLSAKVNALSDSDLNGMNNRFVRLYQDKCFGGGVFCSDTTNMRTIMQTTFCFGCGQYEALEARLANLGL